VVKINRTNIHWAFLLLLVVILGAAGYVYYSATAAQGVLEVTTYPEGARIYIDGGEVGISPARITGIQLGLRDVSVGKEGYESYSRLFQFNPGSHRQMVVYLSDKDIEMGPSFERIATTSGGSLSNEDHLYLPTTDGRIFSVDKKSKDLVWETDLENETFLYQPVLKNNQLFIPSFYGPLYCLDQETGQLIWGVSLPERLVNLVETDNGLLGMSFRSQFIFLDFDGEIVWESDPGRTLVSRSLYVENNQAYILSDRGHFLQVDLTNGNIETLEQYEIGSVLQVAQSDTHLAAAGSQRMVLMWDKENRSSEIKRFEFPNLNRIFLTSELLIFGDNQGVMKAVEIESGEEIWSRNLYTPTSSFAFFEDNLYFGTHDGSVFILDKETGEVFGKRALRVQSRITSISTDDDPSLLHVTNRGGKITTLFLPPY